PCARESGRASSSCPWSSKSELLPLEVRRPLLEEGLHPLLSVLGGKGEMERLPFRIETSRKRRLERLVDRLLGEPDSDRALRCYGVRDALRLREPCLGND